MNDDDDNVHNDILLVVVVAWLGHMSCHANTVHARWSVIRRLHTAAAINRRVRVYTVCRNQPRLIRGLTHPV